MVVYYLRISLRLLVSVLSLLYDLLLPLLYWVLLPHWVCVFTLSLLFTIPGHILIIPSYCHLSLVCVCMLHGMSPSLDLVYQHHHDYRME